MCLILLALHQHSHYPIILLSNRDEFNHRHSTHANFWIENQNVFSGRDAVGGGAWFGITKNGCFACVTNFRDPKTNDATKESRGLLVKDYLLRCTKISPLTFLNEMSPYADEFNGFNLIIGNKKEVFYYSNIEKKIKQITEGIYCMSNHLLDTPWHKVTRAKELFSEQQKFLNKCTDPDKIAQSFYDILSDKTLASTDQLPDTGISKELERLLSSIFVDIQSKGYGTQNSSIALIDKSKKVLFYEKTFTQGVQTSFRKTIVNSTQKPTDFFRNNQRRNYMTDLKISMTLKETGIFSAKMSNILPKICSSVLKIM